MNESVKFTVIPTPDRVESKAQQTGETGHEIAACAACTATILEAYESELEDLWERVNRLEKALGEANTQGDRL